MQVQMHAFVRTNEAGNRPRFCIGGAGNLTHGEKNKAAVDKYGHEALEKTIRDAVSLL